MRNTPARVRIGAAAAVVAGFAMAASPAAPPAQAAADALVSADYITADGAPEQGVPRNYAVNLAASASAAQFADAVARAEALGAVVLEQYPEFNSFFAQSADGAFAGTLNNEAAGVGLPIASIGPTRQAPVSGAEVVVPDVVPGAPVAPGAGGGQGASQLDEYAPDPENARAWGLTAIGAIEAAAVDVPLEPVTVGVLDTGIDATHPDLAAQVDADKSVGCQVNGVPNPAPAAWADDHYHGTHVAGTIAAANNGAGLDGVAPRARLAAVKVSNADGLFYPEYVACGFVWAADHDFDVTNNSYYVDPWEYWVPTEASQAAGLEVVRRAVEYSAAAGVVHFGAEGNSDTDHDNPTTDSGSPNDLPEDQFIRDRDVTSGVDIPSMLPGVISVSAVAMMDAAADPAQADLARSTFSNYGVDSVDVAAPGTGIYSTIPMRYRSNYTNLNGTSMASPHAAGVGALLRAIHPEAGVDEITALLKKHAAELKPRLTADPAGKAYEGAGLVNALAAVLKDQPRPTIGAAEYSVDGTTWLPLDGAGLPAAAYLRVPVSGPVTRAVVSIPGPTAAAPATLGAPAEPVDAVTAEATADGSFDGSVVVETGLVDFEALRLMGSSLTLDIAAYGRNNDERADDDVTAAVRFTVAEEKDEPLIDVDPESTEPATPAPVDPTPVDPTPAPEGPAPTGDAPAAPASTRDKGAATATKLAATGADAIALLAALAALAVGAGALGASKRRAGR
ncbi:S8 family serine peptidase [Actinomyces sp. B33]|uniref:S8 family peptidase n=1 Tax=Actinomyces sp. B33 TaxID=2942131 RepID=UPI00233FCA6D|nr:S8 family serine peptidase [Actinomyces sp. B33]MDC4232719.1 S8 family serine peptidase [Actinomyces sp. B33]